MKTFNADERSKERESSAVTINGRVFHPVRITPRLTRESMRLARRQSAKLAEAEQHEKAERFEEADDASTEAIEISYEQIAILVRNGDDAPPDIEFLREGLEPRLLPDLITFLMGSDEDEADDPADPTQGSTST